DMRGPGEAKGRNVRGAPGHNGVWTFHGNNILSQARRYGCGSVNRSQACSRCGWETLSGNERTMRSAITLGLGILVATAAPGLRAQAKPSTSSSAKSAQEDAGKPAQQTAKPAA